MKNILLSLFLSSFFLVSIAHAETLTYYQDTGDDAGYSGDSSVYYGNTFVTNTVDLNITSVSVFGKRSGTPTTCNVGLKAVNGSHYPTGAFLVSVNEDISAWSTSDAWHVTDIADTLLSASTEYALVYECASAGSYFNWRGDSSGSFSPKYLVWDTAPIGSYNGADNTQSLMYRIYTDPVTPPAGDATTSAQYLQACYDLNGTSTCNLIREAGNIQFIMLIFLTLALFYTIEHFYYHLFPSRIKV